MNLSCIEEVENLIDKRLIDKPYCFTIMLGIAAQGALKATSKNLMSLVESLPEDSVFTVGVHGTEHVPLTTMSMILGGHVRVGFEDNACYTLGRLAKSNAELVTRTARIAKELNLEIATPKEARELIQI
jgi:3-keto-5-aminohexanoate cleavage enzyme